VLRQIIFTSTSAPGVSLIDKVNLASYSVASCKELGLRGRVLVIPEKAINVIEGQGEIVKAYVDAITRDSLIGRVDIHDERSIDQPEFEDYSVWMSYKPDIPMRSVYQLTPANFHLSLPDSISSQARDCIKRHFSLENIAA
jgi:predicted sulfurtransferase